MEKEKDAEIESHKKIAHKSEKKMIKLHSSVDKLEKEKRESESQLKVQKEAAEAEINLKQEVWFEVVAQGCSVIKAIWTFLNIHRCFSVNFVRCFRTAFL